MLRNIIPLVALLLTINGYGQNELVYLHLDKYSCHTGDSVYFSGYVLKGPYLSKVSTNLYVEQFAGNGRLLSRDIFPIDQGLNIGQVKVPDSIRSDNYYLRAFTRYQLNFDSTDLFTAPILVYNKDKPQPLNHKKQNLIPNTFTGGTIKGINWITTVYKENQLSCLLSVDSGISAPRNLRLVKLIKDDSIYSADVRLSPSLLAKYTLFPVDTAREMETILLFEDSNLIGRQFLHLRSNPDKISIKADTLDVSATGYNSFEISIADTNKYNASISVIDADRSISPPTDIYALKHSRTEDLTRSIKQLDTNFISFSGTATTEFGRRIKDRYSKNIVIVGVKDTSFLFTKVVPIDSLGKFKLESLFFFDNIDLQFQINGSEDASSKNVRLNLAKFIPPIIDTANLRAKWEDDTVPMDTIYTKKETLAYEPSKVKTLKPDTVEGWKNPLEELNDTYTTGAFSEQTVYSFDLRKETQYRDLGSYLRSHFMRFQGGYSSSDTPYDVMGHPILYYVDEQNYLWQDLLMFDWDRLSYVKCFESAFIGDDPYTKWKTGIGGFTLVKDSGKQLGIPVQKTNLIIAIYQRKGLDFRTMPGGLKKLPVKGYTNIVKFNTDRLTLYWEPLAVGNKFRIRFNNNETAKRFRVVIDGINGKGEIVHKEQLIE